MNLRHRRSETPRRRHRLLASALVAVVAAFSLLVAFADTFTISFESPTYSTGTIHNQDGWSSSGAAGSGCAVYDHGVAAVNAAVQALAPSFGAQALRISNAVASGCFGDQTFSRSLGNEAGETSAQNGGMSSGSRQNYFEAEWDFISTTPGTNVAPGPEQPGLSVVASPDRGDGARMSWIQMKDTPGGIELNFNDYQKAPAGPNAFVQRTIATGLARNASHRVKITMRFLDGPANDIVTVSVDGVQKLVGTSWEDYFRDQESNPTRTVDSVLFRTSVAAAGTAGQGFYIDNLTQTSAAAPAAPAAVFVDDDGHDLECNGSSAASRASAPDGTCAFKTIARGYEVVASGGTITVGAGSYPESLTLTGKPVTITGAGTGQTILEGANTRTIGISSSVNESNLTIQDLTIQNYTQYGVHFVTGSLATVKFEDVEILSNGIHGFWSQSFDVNGLTLNRVNASNNNALPNAAASGRGVWIINGTRQNLSITNSTFNNNRLVGLDLSDGETLSTTISGNTISGNGDSGLGVLGAEGSVTLANNTLTNNGRYGIEIKIPGGLTSGTPTIVVENNTVSRTVDATDARDHGGIVVIRRSQVTPINADQPAGVLIQNNVVSGYRRKPSGATGDGFGIVVAGTNMVVRNNVLDNNDVALQAQAGNTPDVQGTDFFDRDSSSSYSGLIELNDVKTSNTIGIRGVNLGAASDMTRNWFGTPTGPTNAANVGGTGTSVVGANVTFSPWLGNGTDTAPGTIGFQPNVTPLHAIPTRLAYATQPAGATEGSPFGTQPVVRAEDANGNLGFNFGSQVTLTIGTNPETAALLGTASVTATNGVATFANVGLNDSGTGYTLVAADSGLTGATSTAFDVVNASPAVTVTAPTAGSQTLIGRQVTATATFTDAGANDTHTCAIDWGDGSPPTTGTLVEPSGGNPGSCTGVHNFSATGSAPIQVTVTDDDAGAGNNSVAFTRNQGTFIVTGDNLTTTEAGGTAQFTVALAAAPIADVAITLSSSNTNEGTVSPQSLTFTPANFSTPQTVTVTGVAAGAPNGNVQYTIQTSAALSGDPAYSGVNPPDVNVTNQGTVTPVVSIANATLPSAPTATTPLAFTVTLNAAAGRTVTVRYATANGTATAPSDYTSQDGTLTFAPGETTKTVTVQVLPNTPTEADETFFVDLSQPTEATIGTARATGTITGTPLGGQSCAPRPNIDIQTQIFSGRRAAITVRADTTSPNSENRLTQIQFATPNNATVTMNGQPVGTGLTTLPADTTLIVFNVQQTNPNASFTVPFTIRDTCGPVEKFVGGGKDAYAQ